MHAAYWDTSLAMMPQPINGAQRPRTRPSTFDVANGFAVVGAGTAIGNFCGSAFDKPFEIGEVPADAPFGEKFFGIDGCPPTPKPTPAAVSSPIAFAAQPHGSGLVGAYRFVL